MPQKIIEIWESVYFLELIFIGLLELKNTLDKNKVIFKKK